MKKINSNSYGSKIIFIGIIFLVLIPIILWIVETVFSINIVRYIRYVFEIIGLLILICFFIHLRIEMMQDKKIDKYYSKHKNIKIKLSDNKYECGNCGNRNVSSEDILCSICSVKFDNIRDRLPQEIIDEKKIK